MPRDAADTGPDKEAESVAVEGRHVETPQGITSALVNVFEGHRTQLAALVWLKKPCDMYELDEQAVQAVLPLSTAKVPQRQASPDDMPVRGQ